jgi:hypothetical protein
MMRDQETKKEIDSITSLCLGQLKSTQENHGDRISNIRSKAEKCLTKDYLVYFLCCWVLINFFFKSRFRTAWLPNLFLKKKMNLSEFSYVLLEFCQATFLFFCLAEFKFTSRHCWRTWTCKRRTGSCCEQRRLIRIPGQHLEDEL